LILLTTVLFEIEIKNDIKSDNYDNIIKNLYKIKNLKLLTIDDDWLIFENNNNIINIQQLKIDYLTKQYNTDLLLLQDEKNKINITSYKKYKIYELFDIIKKPKIKYTEQKLVPMISAKKINDGIKCFEQSTINTFTKNKIVLITGGDGGAGLAFYQPIDFSISSMTIVLTPNDKIKLDMFIGLYIQQELSKYKIKYNRAFNWTLKRIKNDIIKLPYKDNNIDYQFIYDLYK
jgi:hypothetical protein